MSRWEEWQRARRMRDGQESEKRRENRLPERRRWADRGGDSLRGLNRRVYARGPGLKGQVHDKSQTREPTGERCGGDVGAMELYSPKPCC